MKAMTVLGTCVVAIVLSLFQEAIAEKDLYCLSTTTVRPCVLDGQDIPNGGKWWYAENEQFYYECVNDALQLLKCPPHRFFDYHMHCSMRVCKGVSYGEPTIDPDDPTKCYYCMNSVSVDIPCDFTTTTTTTTTTETSVPGTGIPCVVDGQVLENGGKWWYEGDYHLYYECVDNNLYVFPCPPHRYFDYEQQCSLEICRNVQIGVPFEDPNDPGHCYYCLDSGSFSVSCSLISTTGPIETTDIPESTTSSVSSSTPILAPCSIDGNVLSAGDKWEDSVDDTRYYECIDDALQLQTCPPHNFFDIRYKECSLEFCRNKFGDKFIDPNDHTKCYQCLDGGSAEIPCDFTSPRITTLNPSSTSRGLTVTSTQKVEAVRTPSPTIPAQHLNTIFIRKFYL